MARVRNVAVVSLVALATSFLTLVFVGTEAEATFIVDPSPGGVALNLDNGKDLTATTGVVGSETIGIASSGGQLFDAANGNATIKPVKDGLLNSLTFTPVHDDLFSDFSFRGQLLSTANGTVTVHWVDSLGISGNIQFTGLGQNADFTRVGIYSIDGETLKSITLTAGGDGFKESKQFEFSQGDPLDPQSTSRVSEPASLVLLGVGLLGMAGIGWKTRRSAKPRG